MISIFVIVILLVDYSLSEIVKCQGTHPCNGTKVDVFQGFCYCYNDEEWGDFATQVAWCENNFLGSQMISIHSYAEHLFLTDFVGYSGSGLFYIWIGLRNNGSFWNCPWDDNYWIDDTPTDYHFQTFCATYQIADKHFALAWDGDFAQWFNAWGVEPAPTVCKYQLFCFGVWAAEKEVCSGHGSCWSDDVCSCNEGYYGQTCNVTECFGYLSNDTDVVCNQQGECGDLNECICDPGYHGPNCSDLLIGLCFDEGKRKDGKCYENFGILTNFSSASETCLGWKGNLGSNMISLHSQSQMDWLDTNIRSGSEMWIGLKKYPDSPTLSPCPPLLGYDWEDKTNDTFAVDHMNISCDSMVDLCIGWTGVNSFEDFDCEDSETLEAACEYPIPRCTGHWSYEFGEVCSGKGICVEEDNCSCIENYFGSDCELWMCFEFQRDDLDNVCSGHGSCVSPDFCECESGYLFEDCNTTYRECNNIAYSDPTVCSSHGSCHSEDFCVCDPGWGNTWCQATYLCTLEEEMAFEDWCYWRTDSWDIAEEMEEYCINSYVGNYEGGNLVSIHSEGEYEIVQIQLNRSIGWNPEIPKGSAFIGLKKKNWLVYNCTYEDDLWNMEWSDGTNVTWYILNHQPDCKNIFTYILVGHYGAPATDSPLGVVEDFYYAVCKIEVPFCFGKNASEDSVCAGKGLCMKTDECFCSNRLEYKGTNCNVTFCDDIMSNETENVCSGGHGSCWPYETCTCEEDYFGDYCEVTLCDGVYSNETTDVCSGHGRCFPKDTCECEENYFGEFCNITTCNGIISNDTENKYCNGHGSCLEYETCVCFDEDEYFGDLCEYTYCNGISSISTYPRVCNGKGTCFPFGTCQCEEDYFGVDCNITTCNGVFSNDSSVCTNKGVCVLKDFCECEEHTGGTFCDTQHTCNNVGDYDFNGYCYRNLGVVGSWNLSEETCMAWHEGGHLVSIHSVEEDEFVSNLIEGNSWIGLVKLEPVPTGLPLYPCPVPGSQGYLWSDGSNQSYALNEKTVGCVRNDTCFVVEMDGIWYDSVCNNYSGGIQSICKYEIHECYGVPANNVSRICSSHGWCFSEDECVCYDYDEYYGASCNITFCDDIPGTDLDRICSSHGSCWPFDLCNCIEDYYGERCEITTCFGEFSNDTAEDGKVCFGHGDCWPKDECLCEEVEGYYGQQCNEFFNASEPPFIHFNTSILYIPFHVPVDVNQMYRRDIFDGQEIIPCGERIANWEEYLGRRDVPEAKCWWEMNGTSVESTTYGIAYQINYDSVLYNKSEDGGDATYPLIIRLLSEEKNVTVFWTMKGEYIVPPRPDEDEGGDDGGGPVVGGIVAGAVGGLAVIAVVFIILGGCCVSILVSCLICCFVLFLAAMTGFCGLGILTLVFTTGTTAATTGVGAAVVGKEVHDEVMDEGPDFVKDVVKERWDERQQGKGDVEMDLMGTESGEEKYITDNLQEAVLRQDEEFGESDGLDLDDDDDIAEDGSGSEVGDFEIELEEEEKERISVSEKMEKIRREKTDRHIGLGLDTRFAKKKKIKLEKKLRGIEEEMKKEERRRIRKEEKREGKGLNLRKFEKKKKKEEEKDEVVRTVLFEKEKE